MEQEIGERKGRETFLKRTQELCLNWTLFFASGWQQVNSQTTTLQPSKRKVRVSVSAAVERPSNRNRIVIAITALALHRVQRRKPTQPPVHAVSTYRRRLRAPAGSCVGHAISRHAWLIAASSVSLNINFIDVRTTRTRETDRLASSIGRRVAPSPPR